MNKIAVFVEGLGEQIFVRQILFTLINLDKLSFECAKLQADSIHDVPYTWASPEPEAHFLIVNVGNDEKVLDAIYDNIGWLRAKGYVKVIGLRDMYSARYCKQASVIDDRLNQKYIEGTRKTITEKGYADAIHFHFSIMELEAWWLAMYGLFSKIDTKLTLEFIQSHRGYDLATINPETEFFHPAQELKEVLALAGIDYDKHRGDVERLVKQIDDGDILQATENGRCGCFEAFYNDLISY